MTASLITLSSVCRDSLTKDGDLWIVSPESVSEIGCIHTCQGLALDYVGVIIGQDLKCVAAK